MTISADIKVLLNEEKIKEDEKWDGLKGYLTNSELSAEQVINNYSQLWKIENAFRISKTDLRLRPIYHRKRYRIEAHICIAFAAYTVFKELERLLILKNIKISARKVIELTKTIYKMQFRLPESRKKILVYNKFTAQQELIIKNF